MQSSGPVHIQGGTKLVVETVLLILSSKLNEASF
jgi:hypothetical protein